MIDEKDLNILAKIEWRASEAEPKPDLSFLPANERRRLTALEKAVMSVAWRCLKAAGVEDTTDLKIVFASRWGEIGTTLKLLRQLYDEGEMSPAGFSNSVHNAAPGHLSLFLKDHASYTAIAAGADSYEMGLLEASTYSGKVLFIYAEENTPEYYRPHFDSPQSAHAIAMLLC